MFAKCKLENFLDSFSEMWPRWRYAGGAFLCAWGATAHQAYQNTTGIGSTRSASKDGQQFYVR